MDDIKTVVTYLTIAAGTGRGNRVSRWSAEAIHTHTGLAWVRAKDAINKLIATKFICVSEEGSRTRPVYEIQPFEVVLDEARRSLSDGEKYAVNDLMRGAKLTASTRSHAARLVMRGLLWENGTAWSVESPTLDAGDMIWLPNTLVTGTSKGEPSPVRRVRQCGNLDALRLLVEVIWSSDTLSPINRHCSLRL
jgi:hypothetical protein